MANATQNIYTLETPISETQDTVVVDKIVVDFQLRKAVMRYRVGALASDDSLRNASEHSLTLRKDDFTKLLNDAVSSGTDTLTHIQSVVRSHINSTLV